jgi:hypothetical protein
MSTMSRWTVVTLVTMLAGTPVAAQQDERGQHRMTDRDAMQHCMAMMGGPQADMILQHRDALGLSAEQVRRLEAVQAETAKGAAQHMQPVMEAHMAAAELLRSDTPDFKAYEERLSEGADHMVRAHVNMARAAVQARQVLTSDQRSRLETLMPTGSMGMMQGGEQGAMAGMAGMMMACPMMGAANQAPEAHRH